MIKKVISIVGARPQFIKLAPIYRAFMKYKDIKHIVLHTGQHYDFLMSDIFFKSFGIVRPDIDLKIGSSPHHIQTGEMIKGIGVNLERLMPEMVLIYGDTNSTLAGAIAASKLGIPVAHIESGLRSYVRTMPEEINRVVADRLSDILFCPSMEAVRNLDKEGIAGLIKEGGDFKRRLPPYVIICGDLMYDILLYTRRLLGSREQDILKRYRLERGGYALATVHRAENTDNLDNLINILSALNTIGREIDVILPLHPRTRDVMEKNELITKFRGIKLIEPCGYIEMLVLEANAKVILTDSGGVQKEAFWLCIPCVTLRDRTEWVETVMYGYNILAGSDTASIIKAYKKQIMRFRPKRVNRNIYGDGRAAPNIVAWIRMYLR